MKFYIVMYFTGTQTVHCIIQNESRKNSMVEIAILYLLLKVLSFSREELPERSSSILKYGSIFFAFLSYGLLEGFCN